MTRNTKILLAVIGGLLLLCLCASIAVAVATGFFISRTATTESSAVSASSGAIADFDLPMGYAPDYAVNVLGFRIVGFQSDSGNGHIVLAEAPEGFTMDAERLQSDLQGILRDRGYRWFDEKMRMVDEQPVTIRGTQTTLQIAESDGGNGPYRQATAAFPGENGPAWVMFATPVDEWDQGMVDAFLASIR